MFGKIRWFDIIESVWLDKSDFKNIVNILTAYK